MADTLVGGVGIRMLTVIDEFTRECLCIQVAYSLKSDDVLEALGDLFLTHGLPEHIRSDNGSEFTAGTARMAAEAARQNRIYRAGKPVGKRVQ